MLPIPEDLRRFKMITLHKTVIMGRRTFESLPGGKPLKDRKNIVLSKQGTIRNGGVEVVSSVGRLLEKIADLPPDDVYVMGGESLYRELLPFCTAAHVTKIDASFQADRHMVNLDKCAVWELVSESPAHEYQGIRYRFAEYCNGSVL